MLCLVLFAYSCKKEQNPLAEKNDTKESGIQLPENEVQFLVASPKEANDMTTAFLDRTPFAKASHKTTTTGPSEYEPHESAWLIEAGANYLFNDPNAILIGTQEESIVLLKNNDGKIESSELIGEFADFVNNLDAQTEEFNAINIMVNSENSTEITLKAIVYKEAPNPNPTGAALRTFPTNNMSYIQASNYLNTAFEQDAHDNFGSYSFDPNDSRYSKAYSLVNVVMLPFAVNYNFKELNVDNVTDYRWTADVANAAHPNPNYPNHWEDPAFYASDFPTYYNNRVETAKDLFNQYFFISPSLPFFEPDFCLSFPTAADNSFYGSAQNTNPWHTANFLIHRGYQWVHPGGIVVAQMNFNFTSVNYNL